MDYYYETAKGSFQPSFESLYHFSCPEWFRNAKFGIWSHWGPQSVPMYGDWYARNMYVEGSPQYLYHLRTYGHPSKFGYKDIVQRWKAENFNPEELMGRYKKAGARYFVAQAMHHDHFFNYPSARNPFNSANYGPHKDIVGLWKEAAVKEGLLFGLSEHHGASFEWFNTNKLCDKKGPMAGVPYDGYDPEWREFYHDNAFTVEPGYVRHHYTWDERWYPVWYEDIKEVVDRYEPEMLYSDGALPFYRNYADVTDPTWLPGLSMAAHLYNSSETKYGENRAVYLHKDKREEYHRIGLLDFERSMGDEIRENPWQTDTCLGHWFYDVRETYKSAVQVTDLLVDIVSKNGNLLLNLPQRPDGTLDEECSFILDGITKWMGINGEGIYDTRPYQVSGEGVTSAEAEKETVWTPYDVRYTQKGNTVYAFLMGRPRTAALHCLRNASAVKNVQLLGYGELAFSSDMGILTAALPEGFSPEGAWCLKITY